MAPRSIAISAEAACIRINRLRHELRMIEAGFAADTPSPERGLALGVPEIDAVLDGGFGRGALHEIAAAGESQIAAATGFALAVVALAAQGSRGARERTWEPTRTHVLWVAEDLSQAENGAPYGPGLDHAGVAPERLITVAAARGRDLLWAMEEGLRCRAFGVVIGETREPALDQVATRRLSLAATAGAALGLILRTAPDDTPSAAATRWIIGAAPRRNAGALHGVGPPRFAIRLVRNRRGRLGAWIVEWNNVERRFELAANPEPLAGAAFDRPRRAQVA
jgi:protein ImuA